MSARLPNVLRASVAFLGTLVPIAPGLLSGCGTTAAAPAAATGDAAVSYVSVITQGGGDGKSIPPAGPGASGSPSGSGAGSTSGAGGSSEASESGSPSGSSGADEAGESGSDDASESGSLSGSGSAGSGGASGSSSGSGNSAGAGEGGSSGAPGLDAARSVCDDYVIPKCGTTPCDLRSNTCCSTVTLQTRCIQGANAACDSDEGTLHCWEACECSGGKVCCAVSNTIVGAVQTECQAVAEGSHCVPYPSSTTMASVQFCEVDSECKNGQPCVPQTCTYDGISARLYICGLQDQAPFNCKM